ncbi:prolipoprotein diacylglyceryl transferase [Thiomicrorhabdus sp. 6S2-11]|uniref:Phosphatidylglycerol--prolipoprotein diacylglyceryl transferase n=1 Tax=Thiomicrorhabdus marina TaxID=2818442 RepID=A0ABS3Q4G0_9GAMM|nr:prolipoprotein diacylglyceryl transferase [Thiomicrorhabdus marina]MBO1927224.1 prolipoprotein diacylglyceryl transferase [Thiomicrorhabdus marina]
MWTYPEIDPVAMALGPLQIHWYGLMYLIAFVGGWALGVYRAKSREPWNSEMVGDLLFYVALGVIAGGRIGYILFYDLAHYIEQPLDVFKVWQGGMSFHGGLLGVTVALILFARKTNQSLLQVGDFVAPLVPIGLLTGRIGNFINGELWGKVTDSPLGMAVYDPNLQATVTKYPTQLLEALLEGLVLLIILLWYARKPRPAGSVAGLFLVGYGTFRFFVEFFRVPDQQLGYLLFDWVTMGQILSTPMILIGLGLIWWAYRRNKTA